MSTRTPVHCFEVYDRALSLPFRRDSAPYVRKGWLPLTSPDDAYAQPGERHRRPQER